MVVNPETVPFYEPSSTKIAPLNPDPTVSVTMTRHTSVPFDSLYAAVAREYIVDGILEKNSVALMYGPPAAGKSFVVLDMMCSVATQTTWMGRSTFKANVMYVCLERFEQIKYRVAAWQKVHKIDSIPARIDPYSYQLSNTSDVDSLIEEIQSTRATDVTHTLVVIDTLSQAIVGQDENLQSVMSRVMGACKRIVAEADCTILLVHHASKSDSSNARGSSVLLGAVSTALNVRKTGQSNTITVEKQSDGISGNIIKFRLCPVSLTDGQSEYANSAVPVWQEDIAGRISQHQRIPTKLLELLRSMLPSTQKYEAQSDGNDAKIPIDRKRAFSEANDVLYKDKPSIEASRRQFNRDLKVLSENGSVSIGSDSEILVSPFDLGDARLEA